MFFLQMVIRCKCPIFAASDLLQVVNLQMTQISGVHTNWITTNSFVASAHTPDEIVEKIDYLRHFQARKLTFG